MPEQPRRPDTRPLAHKRLRDACWRGDEPAEQLDPADRDQLVAGLVAAGWTVTEIAAHTQMSTYTTGRIVERLRAQQEAQR